MKGPRRRLAVPSQRSWLGAGAMEALCWGSTASGGADASRSWRWCCSGTAASVRRALARRLPRTRTAPVRRASRCGRRKLPQVPSIHSADGPPGFPPGGGPGAETTYERTSVVDNETSVGTDGMRRCRRVSTHVFRPSYSVRTPRIRAMSVFDIASEMRDECPSPEVGSAGTDDVRRCGCVFTDDRESRSPYSPRAPSMRATPVFDVAGASSSS